MRKKENKQQSIEIESMWPDRYVPNWKKLKESTRESPFGEAAFELLKEAGIHSVLVAALIPKESLKRNDAILCALVLKVSKLTKAIIAMTAHLGGDRQLILARELIEAMATLNYLLEDKGDGARFDQFVKDSLIVEREFLKTIDGNISERNSVLPIEESMKRSVEKTAKAAGIEDIKAIPSRSKIGWPNAESLISLINSNAYLSYRAGSSVMHTKWDDLLRNHLIQLEDGTFEPNFDEPPIRPQPLYAAGILLIDSLLRYLSITYPEALGQFEDKLKDLKERLIKVYQLHSKFLDEKNKKNKI